MSAMKVVCIFPGHNATVGVFENGACRRILHEEKFSNVKNHSGFPKQALAYLRERGEIDGGERFVVAGTMHPLRGIGGESSLVYQLEETTRSPARRAFNRLEYVTGWKPLFTGLRNVLFERVVAPRARRRFAEYLGQEFGVNAADVAFHDHHLCHALTPLFFYGLEGSETPVLLMTVDGDGDKSGSKIFAYGGPDKEPSLLANSSFDSSVGLVYLRMTEFLGMKPNEHEYKVMGLAAYVTEEKYYGPAYRRLKELVWVDEDSLTFRSRFNTNVVDHFLRRYCVGQRFDNLAAALQRVTEELITDWIDAAVKKTGISTVALSGGVFMNVKMNQRILSLPSVTKVYVMPSCGDESLVIGAAAGTFRKGGVPLRPIESMYWGHTYTNDEVAAFLDEHAAAYSVRRCDDIEREVAELLSRFEHVARFQGAGEWGARSLCNRAVLGNASKLQTFHEINDAIKMRDFWMPFAPTILDTWAERYVRDWERIQAVAEESTKYMILTFDATDLAREHLRAAIHQKDHTLRPQVLSEADNPRLYRLLKYYEEMTGMGGVLNTSLNMHGYPLVGTLEQAMFTFDNSGLKHMALEDFLVSKEPVSATRASTGGNHETSRGHTSGSRDRKTTG